MTIIPATKKPDALLVFAHLVCTLRENLKVMSSPDVLRQVENIVPAFESLQDDVQELDGFNIIYQQRIEELDSALKTAPPPARKVIEQQKQRFQQASLKVYLEQAPRLARTLKDISDRLLTEFSVEGEKLSGTFALPHEIFHMRREFEKQLANTNDLSAFEQKEDTEVTPKTKEALEWVHHVCGGHQADLYEIFNFDSAVLARMKEVPEEFRPSVTMMLAWMVFDTASAHAVALFECIGDERGRKVRQPG